MDDGCERNAKKLMLRRVAQIQSSESKPINTCEIKGSKQEMCVKKSLMYLSAIYLYLPIYIESIRSVIGVSVSVSYFEVRETKSQLL